MKSLHIILIFTVLFLSLGCNKEDIIKTTQKYGLKSGANLTSTDKDLSTYIQVADYLPSTPHLIRQEREEIVNAVNNNTSYRDRNLNEAMFLFEAVINLDVNHLPIPLKKFKKEITVFEIAKTETGKISGSSIKCGIQSMIDKIVLLGASRRFVGSIDAEPIFEDNSKVKVRVVYNSGEPIESGPVDGFEPNYERPYGDEYYFLNISGAQFSQASCQNIIQEENAAYDLSGKLYSSGTFPFYALSNPHLYTYTNGAWQFIMPNPGNSAYISINTIDLMQMPLLLELYTNVNVHTFHWSLNHTYDKFYDPATSRNGQIYLNPVSTTNDFWITIDALHGATCSQVFDIGSCSNHMNLSINTWDPNYNKTKRIFLRNGAYGFPRKGAINICMKNCEVSDFETKYWEHLTDPAVLAQLPASNHNKDICGTEVLPAKFYYPIRNGQGVIIEGQFQTIGNIEHFLFPSYGQKIMVGSLR